MQKKKYNLSDPTQDIINQIRFWYGHFNNTCRVRTIDGKAYLELTDDVKFLLSTGIEVLLALGDNLVEMYKMVEPILNNEKKPSNKKESDGKCKIINFPVNKHKSKSS